MRIIDLAQHFQIGPIHPDEDKSEHSDGRPRRDVDVEDRTPADGFGQESADRRPKSWRQHRDHAQDRRYHRPLRTRKEGETGGEHGGDHGAADKALQHAKGDHGLDVPGRPAKRRRQRKKASGQGEQPAGGQGLGQEGGKRDHHQLGHQIAGLNPADLVGPRRQARLDVVQRGRDDLNIDQGHELAEGHNGEDKIFQRGRQVFRRDERSVAFPRQPVEDPSQQICHRVRLLKEAGLAHPGAFILYVSYKEEAQDAL